ncbi:MAG: HAD-IA family hydrolase [Candidatus Micrarchaeia archaeon]
MFDLGGVVINFNNSGYYKYLSEVSGFDKEKIAKIIENKYLQEFEKGKISIDFFEKQISKELKIKRSAVKWRAFYEQTVKFNYDVVELIQELHKEFIISFLSNIDKVRYNYTKKILDLNLFDFRFVSCNMGIRKPNLLIYKEVLNILKVMPEEAVFIDDRIENVLSAKSLGINAIQFKNRRDLDIKLSKIIE